MSSSPDAPASSQQRALLRAKIDGWREADEVSCRHRVSTVPPPARAVASALELWDLRPELFDLPRTEVEQAEIAGAAAAWQTLRATWPR